MARRTTLKTLGANVRKLRTEVAGLTQAELAENVDLAVESISRLEAGKLNASVTNLEKVAAALDVPIVALFDGVTAPPADRPRPGEKRILNLIADLDDDELDAVHRGLKALLGLRKPKPSPRRKPTSRGRRRDG